MSDLLPLDVISVCREKFLSIDRWENQRLDISNSFYSSVYEYSEKKISSIRCLPGRNFCRQTICHYEVISCSIVIVHPSPIRSCRLVVAPGKFALSVIYWDDSVKGKYNPCLVVDGLVSPAMLMLYQIAVIGLSCVIHLQQTMDQVRTRDKESPRHSTHTNDLKPFRQISNSLCWEWEGMREILWRSSSDQRSRTRNLSPSEGRILAHLK